MTWHPGTEAPPRQGRYAITQDGRTWRAAGWTRDGWFDGYQRLRSVRGWCEVPAVDLDAGKAAAMMTKLLNAPAGSVSIRQKLTEFAEAEGLSL